jgi:hypothetical protein
MGNKRTTLSRPQVAALLSMTEGEVRRLDGDRLHPHKGADGGWLYRPEEVTGVLRQLALVASAGSGPGVDMVTSAEGGIAADVFSRLEKGEGAARVVIDMRLNPTLVRDLQRTFHTMTRELTISSADRQEIERLVGRPIAGVRDIIAVISQFARSRSSSERAMPGASLPVDEDYGAVIDPETGERRVLTKADAEQSMSSLTKLWSSGESSGEKAAAVPTEGQGTAAASEPETLGVDLPRKAVEGPEASG